MTEHVITVTATIQTLFHLIIFLLLDSYANCFLAIRTFSIAHWHVSMVFLGKTPHSMGSNKPEADGRTQMTIRRPARQLSATAAVPTWPKSLMTVA